MFDHSPPAESASTTVKAAHAWKSAMLRTAIAGGDFDALRSLTLNLPIDAKWVSLNNGASYWHCETNERLVEIGDHLNRAEGRYSFDRQACVEATLEAERALFKPKEP